MTPTDWIVPALCWTIVIVTWAAIIAMAVSLFLQARRRKIVTTQLMEALTKAVATLKPPAADPAASVESRIAAAEARVANLEENSKRRGRHE